MADTDAIVDFLFEVGILAKTPRSGFYFLGSGEQSVAEHINRTAFIGYVLADLRGGVNTGRILKMCLFHDLAESRTSDLNHLHQKYASTDERRAIEDLAKAVPFGDEIKAVITEYEARQSAESRLAKDADTLEFMLSLKEQIDTGNDRAKEWLAATPQRLLTPEGRKLGKKLIKTPSDRWWLLHKDKRFRPKRTL